MSHSNISQEITFLPADNRRLSNFCGHFDAHLRQIEQRLKVEIANRGNQFKVTGFADAVKAACVVMQKLFDATNDELITPEQVHLSMQESSVEQLLKPVPTDNDSIDTVENIFIKTKRGVIKGRGENQQDYLTKIMTYD
ncbi:MAG: phosphate starvation-inducible protein PhoH, partial [Methylococcales bacterium]|nr:phosphate starvation-inducible protein PhoH [Methylococcales bacterium]